MNYKSIIESLLFVWGEPVNLNRIAKTIELTPSQTKKIMDELIETYNTESRGIQIMETNQTYQFCTLKDNYEYVERFCTKAKSRGLSNSMLEVLAIVAYKQPITKLDIETIRGVSSDGPLNSLISRELLCEVGRLEKIGRPIIYGTTDTFLKSFGLKKIEELPDVSEFSKFTEFNN